MSSNTGEGILVSVCLILTVIYGVKWYLVIGIIFGISVWRILDSDTNNKSKRLEIRKLELEVKLLEQELKKKRK